MEEKKNIDEIKDESENHSITLKKNNKSNLSKIYWIFSLLLLSVLVFFLSNFIFSKLNTIEHDGLVFTRERFGDIPVFHYYYYITPKLKYNLYLRNDPRKNNVPVTGRLVEEGIKFLKDETIYLSVNPERLSQCEYSLVGISTLTSFLTDNQFIVKGASPDENLAKEANVSYATCDVIPDGRVILLKASNNTEVIHEKYNCIIINVADCQILEAVEKFEVQTILDARDRRLAQS